MPKKLLIASGGSGGHIYPALSLAEGIKRKKPDVDVIFCGGGLASNKFFDKSLYSHRQVDCGQVVSTNPLRILQGTYEMSKGILQSRAFLQECKPDLVVGFGSYYAFPVLAAAWSLKMPYALLAADSVPGKVIRLFSGASLLTGIHFPGTARFLKGYSVHVAMPLRNGLQKGAIPKEQACSYYNLDPNIPILLIFGGSQGAQKLNHTILRSLPFLKGIPLQFLHFCGLKEDSDQLRQSYASHGFQSVVKPLELRMDMAWSCASTVVMRAGASSIAEMLEYEIPALLIPYPYSADAHQYHNAAYVAEEIRSANLLTEDQLTDKRLAEELLQLTSPSQSQKLLKNIVDYKNKRPVSQFNDLILGVL